MTFFLIQIKKEIDSIVNAYDSLQFIIAERFTILNNDLLLLNFENTSLANKLTSISDVNSTLIIIKILSSLFLLTFLLYTLTNPFCYTGLIGKTFGLIYKINSNLISLLEIEAIKEIKYRDGLGTDFLISLSNDEKTIDIALKTADMLEFVSLTDYIQRFV